VGQFGGNGLEWGLAGRFEQEINRALTILLFGSTKLSEEDFHQENPRTDLLPPPEPKTCDPSLEGHADSFCRRPGYQEVFAASGDHGC
jgi:hypothetical protein